MGLKWFKGKFWSKNNRRTIETRVTWSYIRVGLYVAVYGMHYGIIYLLELFIIKIKRVEHRQDSMQTKTKSIRGAFYNTLLALITPALSQRRPILRRPLFRQVQISTYRHLGPLLTLRYGKIRKIRKKGKVFNL